MTYIVTWQVIGNSDVTRAELFETLHDADAFYGVLMADKTATCVKLTEGRIL